MNYKNFLLIFLFIILASCSTNTLTKNKIKIIQNNNYYNTGFALVYSDNLYKDKIVSKKIDERSLVIFQRNLRYKTKVKITNLLNNKSIIASVGKKSSYPLFNNSVVSKRIAKEIDLNIDQPYIEIIEILEDSIFIAKKTKTYDEEKNVAVKAPVNSISINDLNDDKSDNKISNNIIFSYSIIVADFYFKDTALNMLKRIKTETAIKKPKIEKMSNNKYRVFLGPFNNINSLQKSYNDINILEFENIKIIKNDQT
tara:strand:+ start:803 stop:1567 length:765 start_codon:yes stop_codon:yes gene_type:complete